MPWTADDARRHTKKARNAKQRRKWATVANAVLESSGDEGRAVRAANAAVARKKRYAVIPMSVVQSGIKPKRR